MPNKIINFVDELPRRKIDRVIDQEYSFNGSIVIWSGKYLKCQHGKAKSICQICGGGSICDCGKRRSRCKKCGGGAYCIPHGKIKSICVECNGSQICEHNVRRYTCIHCNGKGVCEHGVRRSRCVKCEGNEAFIMPTFEEIIIDKSRDRAPNSFWYLDENRERYFEILEEKLEITEPSDWYSKSKEDIKKYGYSGFLNYYNHSLHNILDYHYPNYDWLPWMFVRSPTNFWKNKKHQKKYLNWLGEKLDFQEPEDWYNITAELILNNNGARLIDIYEGSPALMIKEVFDEYEWVDDRFKKIGKNQKLLLNFVTNIFPDYDVYSNFKHPELIFSKSKMKMELDIWIPGKSLAFEYQGEQHYTTFWNKKDEKSLQNLKDLQIRDEEKKEACKVLGIILVEITHNWNCTEDYIKEILYQLGVEL